MVTHSTPSLRDAIQWDVRSWSRALPVWQRAVEKLPRPAKALGIGEREGGLSLWLALQGIDVVCTDLKPLPDATRALHERYGVSERITLIGKPGCHLCDVAREAIAAVCA